LDIQITPASNNGSISDRMIHQRIQGSMIPTGRASLTASATLPKTPQRPHATTAQDGSEVIVHYRRVEIG